MANTIGTLAISVKANVDKAVKGFRKANKSVKSFSDAVSLAKVAVAGFASAAVYKSFNAVANAVDNARNRIDSLAKTADKLGLTTEALQGLRHAAELSGVGVSQLDTGIQRMVRRVSEAALGIGEARGALAELRLDAAELAKLSPDQQFKRIADAFELVNNQSDRIRLAFKLFDTEGVALVNTMRGGSDAITAAQQDAVRLGIAVSRVDAASIEQLNDAVTRTERAMEGLGNKLTIALAPALEKTANRATGATLAMGQMANIGAEASLGLIDLTAQAFGLSGAMMQLEVASLDSQIATDKLAQSKMDAAMAAKAEAQAEQRLAAIRAEQQQKFEETVYAQIDAAANAKIAAEQLRIKTLTERLDGLSRAYDDVAFSERQRLRAQLQVLQATDEQIKQALGFYDAAKAFRDFNDEAERLDGIAEYLIDSIKSPTEALEDFIKEIETLGDRLTAFQKDQLISNKFDELFGDTFKQSTPQSPAALQQGTAAARSAEIAALNRFNNGSEDKRYQDKMIKLSQRSRDYLRDIASDIRDIERREGIEVVG